MSSFNLVKKPECSINNNKYMTIFCKLFASLQFLKKLKFSEEKQKIQPVNSLYFYVLPFCFILKYYIELSTSKFPSIGGTYCLYP